MALVVCKDCSKQFSTDAKRCPHCGAKPPRPPAVSSTNVLVGVRNGLLGIGAIIGVAFVSSTLNPGGSSTTVAREPDMYGLLDSCEEAIRAGLKDPESAKFADIVEQLRVGVLKEPDRWTTMLDVRAKNSFGGYERGVFRCVAKPNKNGFFTVLSIKECTSAESCVVREQASASPAQNNAATAHVSANAPIDGKAIYDANCAACHQPNGQGMSPSFPPLAGSKFVNGSPEANIRLLLEGKNLMPSFAQLSDEDIAAVITYQRQSWGNKGSSIASEAVRAKRASGRVDAAKVRAEERLEELRSTVNDLRGNGGNKPARTREEVERVFDSNKGALYTLYVRESRNNPDMSGKLTVRITIAPNGSVTACKAIASELRNPDFEQKIVARVLLMDFGAKDVGPFTLDYPINFFPTS